MTRRANSGSPLGTDAEGRPVRRALTRDHIIRTALAVLDRDGVDGLSMRKLGAELGVNPMAFYHHLPNKAALFDGVVEAVFGEVAVGLDTLNREDTWREQLAALMRQFRTVLRQHPNVLLILATRPAYTPSLMAFGDRTIGLLSDAGITAHDLLVMISALRSYTIGQLLVEVGQPVGGPTADPDEAAALIAPYPNLATAIAGGYDPDGQYEITLQAMLDGFEQRLGRPRS
ncbi:TetR/AcrR family transcriptional regulator [Micromonospora sp. NBC_01796]|uniref:TetR/AcrR family transcriptional regulator n=1 Tax=Micromonospora sp. NBC_01796 TaxID=2975987 RepID=UPI002DDA98C4|nr:TetR/AcrR family transcriptional regulator [Micromonospora sp. NBC_01796]WSA83798.1 TetR/AcrR family transcriptional regulator [Micromonospora sp. NBC_01796]